MSEPLRTESADSTRDRLLEGALACMRRTGSTRLSFAEVARASGVARQTIYAHFPDREQLLAATVQHAALALTDRIAREVATLPTTAEAVVEVVVAFHEEARRDVAIAQVIAMTLSPATTEQGTVSAESLRLTRGFLRGRLLDADGAPLDGDLLDERAEVVVRMLLSVLAYRSARTETPERLRAFLHRTLVPALGLEPPQELP
ncbi:TetR/AcrR family transcriptional regulator [Nocardioides sp. TRM66260-LWL]|uniref:TetR/AcrR family transcriptional regulator n=1 Tax=Nocardioides sp. TRM66260-LWL TaxID=2874478 RepID=UPI001CC53BBD|nr:TetR/AcrR family transcriptional regulator [Nocardioides sp. TRM66260-LWL]MBZ5736036.1 TetR/AcrR family transcriptional regulator [Nocardioides sp. TRM66260-LWL]